MINLITVELALYEEDFRLPGPIELVWERNFLSSVERNTLAGRYWQFAHDQYVTLDKERDSFFWQNANGNIVELSYAPLGEELVCPEEKIKYSHQQDKVTIYDYDKDLTYHYTHCGGDPNTYKLTAITRHRFAILLFYTSQGLLKHLIDSCGRKLKLTTDTHRRITAIELLDKNHPPQPQERYHYNDKNWLTTVHDALNQPLVYHYNDEQLITRTDRNGHHQHWKHQRCGSCPGQPLRCTARWFNNKQQYEAFDYQPGKTLVKNTLGHTTTHHHHKGNITQVQDPNGHTEQWFYDIDGQMRSYTDPLGQKTYYGYDQYGQQISVSTPNGGGVCYIYKNHKITMAKNSHNAVWIWEYNDQGLLECRIGPDKDITRYHYTDDLLTKIIDPNGQDITLHYNDQDILEKIILPNGQQTQWHYNSQGQLLKAVSGQHNPVHYKHDPLGRITQIPPSNLRLQPQRQTAKPPRKQHQNPTPIQRHRPAHRHQQRTQKHLPLYTRRGRPHHRRTRL